MQKKNKAKKHRVLVSLTLLASLFTQLAAPVAILAEELNETDPVEEAETPVTAVTETPTEPVEDPTEEEPTDAPEEEPIEIIEEDAEEIDPVDLEPAPEEEIEEETDTPDEETDENEGIELLSAEEEEEGIQTLQVDETFDLALMHMNDTHSNAQKLPKMITAINNFRMNNPSALLFHAGDVFSGTLYFNEFQGQADLDLMNLMGIDAMTFGNHEFDLGNSADGHLALRNFVENAEFPFLGTNIDFSGDPLLTPYETKTMTEDPQDSTIYNSIIFNVDGEKVGVFGLTTESTLNIASPMAVDFYDYIATAREAVAELKAQDVNKIIALTHIGYDSDASLGNDLTLAQTVADIDIIVGGHSHSTLSEPAVINADSNAPTVIVQAGANADNLGTLNVQFNGEGEIIGQQGKLQPIRDLAEDPEAVTRLAPYKAVVSEVENEEIGAIAVKDLENPRSSANSPYSVRANETPLGNLVTDAMLAKAREVQTNVAFAVQNSGGIRAPINAGPITVGEVIAVLPFGNDPVITRLTGQQVYDLFELSVQSSPGESGGFLQVSGLRVYFDSTREVGDRVIALYVDNGSILTKINRNQDYYVTTNRFTAEGGDGLTPFREAYDAGHVRDIVQVDWMQFRDYLIQPQYLNGVVDPELEGRITNLLGEELPQTPEIIIADLLERVSELEKEVSDLGNQNQTQAEEIAGLREEMEELQNALEETNADIEALKARLALLEARLAELEGKLPDEETPDEETPEEETPVTPVIPETPEVPGTPAPVTPGADADTNTGGTTKEKPVVVKQNALPAAGMNIVLPLISGATLIISGLGVEIYRKKRNK